MSVPGCCRQGSCGGHGHICTHSAYQSLGAFCLWCPSLCSPGVPSTHLQFSYASKSFFIVALGGGATPLLCEAGTHLGTAEVARGARSLRTELPDLS